MRHEHDPSTILPPQAQESAILCRQSGCRKKRWQVCGRPGCVDLNPVLDLPCLATTLPLSTGRPTSPTPTEDTDT